MVRAPTVLANSLLRSLPQVDAEKVSLMGISWGGVIASTVAGIGPRFAFAIPTYGCGQVHSVPRFHRCRFGPTSLVHPPRLPRHEKCNAAMMRPNRFRHDTWRFGA
jgi:hypothetical protein